MITSRRLLLLFVIVGIALQYVELPSQTESMPVPGQNELVRLPFVVRFGGSYYVEVTMPTVGNPIDLSEESLPCDLSIDIGKDGGQIQPQEVTTLIGLSRIGWEHTDQYRAGSVFHLGRGDYSATVKSRGRCPAATVRGASFTIVEDLDHPTERYLLATLLNSISLVLLVGGLLGLLLLEFRRTKRGVA